MTDRNDILRKISEECKQQKPEAMNALYTMYASKMYNTSYRLLSNRADAQDAMQEAFISAWKAFPRFDLSKSPEKWIRTLVINKSIDMLRKRKHWKADLKENVDVQDISEESIPFQAFSVQMVKDAIMNLPDACRTVLSLYLIEGLDYQEISGYLKLKESSVRSQASRGMAKLKVALKHTQR